MKAKDAKEADIRRSRAAANAHRPQLERDARRFGGVEPDARRRLRALSEDQELSLAHVRSAFSRLSPAARRAGRPDFRDDRPDRRAGAQDRRPDAALDRRDRAPAAHRGQRRRLRRAARHAGGAARRQSAPGRVDARGARGLRRGRATWRARASSRCGSTRPSAAPGSCSRRPDTARSRGGRGGSFGRQIAAVIASEAW